MGDRRSEIGRLAVAILARAQARGVMIATAESCTGGMVFAALTDIAGSSAVMERGFVTYSNDAKAEMLGVDPGMITANGAVSEQVAGAMAEGALARSRAGLAVAVTGVAGPGGSAAKPEGMVCFALAAKGAATSVETRQFGTLGRATVRALSVERACELLLAHLSQN